MIIDGNTIRPDAGKWLVKGDACTQNAVLLSPLDSPQNWQELSQPPPNPDGMTDAEIALAVLEGRL